MRYRDSVVFGRGVIPAFVIGDSLLPPDGIKNTGYGGEDQGPECGLNAVGYQVVEEEYNPSQSENQPGNFKDSKCVHPDLLLWFL